MVLVLVVGDVHIPQCAANLPDAFSSMFAPGRIDVVLITGNVACIETYNFFRTLAPEVRCTRGEYDEQWNSNLPSHTTVTIEGLRIGLVHGHQIVPVGNVNALAAMQRKLDVDVLVSGATHEQKIVHYDRHLFINPGSVTGTFASAAHDVVLPSFVLLDIHDRSVTVFSYQYDKAISERACGAGKGSSKDTGSGDKSGLRIKKKVWTCTT